MTANTAAAALLEAAVALSSGAGPSKSATLKEREQALKITAMERKDAREASLLVWRDEAEDLMERTLTEVRVNALGFLAEVARDHALNLRELEQGFLSSLSQSLATPTRDIEKLANNCAHANAMRP